VTIQQRRRRACAAAVTGAACLSLIAIAAQSANASNVSIDRVALASGGGVGQAALWDFERASTLCALGSAVGFSPVGDGAFGGTVGNDEQVDAFDDGLEIGVNGTPFNPTGKASVSGGQAIVGPATVANKITVTRTERGLPNSPTLRSVVALRNTGTHAVTPTIVWDSNLGSDGQTVDQRSSSGDTTFTKGDRWVVTSQGATPDTSDDPPVTHILYGKGKAKKVSTVEFAPDAGQQCLSVDFAPRLPAGKTRYLLFFTEMHSTVAAAKGSVHKFDRAGLSRALLSGISPKVRKHILNWDVG
jgi:hypothetical protein